jgi:6-pyruvoyltetrahydropterin/6-carboxytetrahydropterin synthase
VSGPRPLAKLSRRYHFSASHRLHTEALDEGRNREVYGKCNNPFGHGHNYTVELQFAGPVDSDTGMVTNLADLDRFARESMLEPFHLQNLNTLAIFEGKVPTTENLVMEVQRIFSVYPYARLERVRVEETPNNSFEFAG